jgi:transcriptional regulator with XRE-family HTH domain
MINLSKEICFKIAEARREEGLSQSDIAKEIGCTQSALSMFEKGNGTKLSDETVKKLSARFNIPLENEKASTNSVINTLGEMRRGYCPDSSCPSNIPYIVAGKLFFRPMRTIASPNGGKFCACCGEVLEKRCPTCNAPLNDGACCGVCGSIYVTPIIPDEVDVYAYTKARIEELSTLKNLTVFGT